MATFVLEVVTPDKTVVKEEVDMAVCPGAEGEFGILPHHVSLLSALKTGPLHYNANGRTETLFISGGFVDVNNNICSVLAESAERAEDIDVARARAAKERAERRLAQKEANIDEIRAESALRRAIMRLQVSQKALG